MDIRRSSRKVRVTVAVVSPQRRVAEQANKPRVPKRVSLVAAWVGATARVRSRRALKTALVLRLDLAHLALHLFGSKVLVGKAALDRPMARSMKPA